MPKNVSYLVKVRGCEWVVLPESKDDLLTLALPVVPVVRLTDVLT